MKTTFFLSSLVALTILVSYTFAQEDTPDACAIQCSINCGENCPPEAPVCGKLGEELITYTNDCWRECRGAEFVQDGPCP